MFVIILENTVKRERMIERAKRQRKRYRQRERKREECCFFLLFLLLPIK